MPADRGLSVGPTLPFRVREGATFLTAGWPRPADPSNRADPKIGEVPSRSATNPFQFQVLNAVPGPT